MKIPPQIKVYGKQVKGKQPSEGSEQITFFAQLEKRYPVIFKVATHIKNEGRKTFQQAQKDKLMGLVKGASDIVIPGCPSLLIEMKSKDVKSKASTEQIEYLLNAQALGSSVCIAYGWEAALQAVGEWVNASNNNRLASAL